MPRRFLATTAMALTVLAAPAVAQDAKPEYRAVTGRR
jgi:hypothetical protein